jgi:hypothetical protein
VILLNQVIQILVGLDERMSGQDDFGLQFSNGLMGRPTAVECDLLRGLISRDGVRPSDLESNAVQLRMNGVSLAALSARDTPSL